MATEDIGSLVVRIEANLKNFESGMNNVSNKVDGLGSTLKKFAGIVASAFVVKEVINFGKEVANAAMEQEKAENRLNTLMMNVNGTTQEQIDGLKKLAAAQQNITTIGDEVTMAGQSQLATFQLSADTIGKLTPAFQDLAVATYGANVSQEQMIQSGNLIGKVMQGQVGALSRVGVSFTKAQEEVLKTGTESEKTAALIEVLNQNFGGLAESTRKTHEGGIVAFNNSIGDMKEMIGNALLPIIDKFSVWFTENQPKIQDFVESGIKVIISTMDTLSNTVKFISDNFDIFGSILAGITAGFIAYKAIMMASEVITKAMTIAQGILNAVMNANPIGLVVVAIGLLVAAGVLLVKNWDTVKSTAIELWNKIEELFGNIGKWFKDRFTEVYNGIKDVFKNIGTFFGGIWTTIKNTFVGIGVKIGEAVGGSFKSAINSVLTTIENIVNGFFGHINGAIDLINKIPGVNIDKIAKINIPRLETGTNFVPFDTMAFLHKGEAVVPADNNPSNPSANNPVGSTFNFDGMFKGAVFNVRSDTDARLIAREIYNLTQSRNRGSGVVPA